MTPRVLSLPFREVVDPLCEVYGLPRGLFNDFCFWTVEGTQDLYLVPAGANHPTTLRDLDELGHRVCTGPERQPTSTLLKMIGANARRNVVEVDADGEVRFNRGEVLEIPEDCDATVVIVRRGRHALGGLTRLTGRSAP